MLISKEVEVAWTNNMAKYWLEKGYPKLKPRDKFMVKVEDLKPRSNIAVEVLCDYCLEEGIETIIPMTYNYYTQKSLKTVPKNCCSKHQIIKTKECNIINFGENNSIRNNQINEKRKQTVINKYGVTNINDVPEFQQKKKENNLKKYGTEWPMQSDEVQLKFKATNQERYGVDHPMALPYFQDKRKETLFENYGVETPILNDEIRKKTIKTNVERYGCEFPLQSEEIRQKIDDTVFERYGETTVVKVESIINKMRQSYFKNGTVKSSKQQRYLNNLFNGTLNYLANKKSFLDIAFPTEMIYIEFDGGGHNLTVKNKTMLQKDFDYRQNNRTYALIRNNWREIRIISLKDFLPSDRILLEMLEYAKILFNEYDFHRVVFDIDNNNVATSKWTKEYNYGELRLVRYLDI